MPIPVGPISSKLWRSAIQAHAEREDLLAVEATRVGEVDGLERRWIAQLGGVEAPLQLALPAGRPLGVDQEAEALLEAERGGLVGLHLLPAGVGHRADLHGIELVEGLFDQHGSSRVVAA